MATNDRALDRGVQRARVLTGDLGREVRSARRAHGLSLAVVGGLVGLSASEVSRIERARVPQVPLLHLATLASVVGLELSARLYPGGEPLRDLAHVALLGRLRDRLPRSLSWRTEVPMPTPGDGRAWDAVIRGSGFVIGVEAETRLRDLQAIDRRIALKVRDSGVDLALLLLADTRANRSILREFEAAIRVNHPVGGRRALDALTAGHSPGGNCVVLL